MSISIVIAWMLMMGPVLAEEATPQVGAPQATTAQATELKPDPGGITTGNASNAIDGAGNSFIVTEPTDKSDPDYAKKRKEFEEFTALAAKEPLAVKLADTVGHSRDWDKLFMDSPYRVPGAFHASGFRPPYLWVGAPKERRPSHDAQLCGVCFRLPGILRMRLRLPIWRGRSERGAY